MSQKHKIPHVEALVDAIGSVNNFSDPSSDAYQLRSPLLLQSFALPGKHTIDTEGRRVFPSSVSGFKASVYDMSLKIGGLSRSRLRPTDGVKNLLGVYRIKSPSDIKMVVEFLRVALDNESIDENTPLSFFLEGDK